MYMHFIKAEHSLTGQIHITSEDMSRKGIYLTPHNHSGDCPILSIDFDEKGAENITFMELEELDEFIATLQHIRRAMDLDPRNFRK